MANTRYEDDDNNRTGTSNRGFASMDPERVREIASKVGELLTRVVMHMSLPLKKLVKLAEQPMQVVTLMNLPLKKRVKRVH